MSRIDFIQSLGTGLALLISVLALVVSIRETNLLKEQQRAAVWPYLTAGPNYNSSGFGIELSNKGIGPALVHSAEVRIDGVFYRSWEEILDSISPGHRIDYDILRVGRLAKTVVKSGEKFDLFRIPWQSDKYRMPSEPYEIAKRMNDGRIRICFCSVLEECWVYDSDTQEVEPGKVTFPNAFGR